jgi:transcription antitermination factor NusG
MAKLYPEPLLEVGRTTATAAIGTAVAVAPAISGLLHEDPGVARWYVACTRSRHERIAYEQLCHHAIESYLPLYESVRQWHDRWKKLLVPAFPGYLFVRIPFAERLRVLTIPGITRFITFGKGAASLPDEELERLRTALSMRKSEPYPYLASGARVRIISGPLRGLSGVVQRGRGVRMIISVDCVCRSLAVELLESDLQLEPQP